MAQGVGGADGLTLQLQAARAMAPGLEVQQLKASVRARLFGIVDTPPTLGGYTIVRLMGRGGMGAVYEARDERGEVVALKALRGCEPAALYRFKHEFRALSDLVHPNLALLYSLVVSGDQAFLTMERIDGVDFLTYVHAAAQDQLAGRLRDALEQLVDGLSALHAAGKLHRDVKPSNVLITREGRVVILDFGLVQELAGPAGSGELAGTPAYMAPELVTGAAPSTASDWYSVGVMLYEALTGRLPFVGGTLDVLRDKCQRDPPPPQAIEPAAEPILSRLCVQLLARDPAARPDRRAIVAALAAVAAEPEGLALGTGEMSPGTGGEPGPISAQGGPLVGRQDELAALRQALAGVRAQQPAVVLLRGGSGVGKTALVESFLDELRGRVILRGRCYEREQVPHNAFDGLIDALAGHLATLSPADQAEALTRDVAALLRLFPGLSRLPAAPRADADASTTGATGTGATGTGATGTGATGTGATGTGATGAGATGAAGADAAPDSRWRERAYAAFKELLGWLASRSADGLVVLHIDDLQWADGDSATLLAALVAAPAPPFLLLGSYRAAATGPAPVVQGLLHQLRGGGARVWELTIEPLAQAEAERLARRLLGPGPAAASAAAVAREAAGIPLFVHELAHDVLGCLSSGQGPWPGRLEDLLAARIGRLPAPARDLLEVLAVAARPLAQSLVIGVPGSPAAGRAALQTLVAARLVRVARSERGELVEVYHDRIRETVLAGLPAERERACHRRLAAAIEACPAEAHGEPEILAHHLDAAGDPVGAREHMIRAAAQAAGALAFVRAAELSLAAIRLCPADDLEGRQALRIDAGQALLHAGNHVDAAACFLAAAAEAQPVAALRLRQRAAEVLLGCGAARRGVALLQEVLSALGCPLPRTHIARVARVARQTLWLHRHGLEFTPRAESEVADGVLLRLDTLRSARLAVVNVDPLTSRMYQLEHLRQCLEVGEPRRIVHAIAGQAAYVSHDGATGAVEAEHLLAEARTLAARHGIADGRYIEMCAGIAAFNVGAWRTSLARFESALPDIGDTPGTAAAAMIHGLCGLWTLGCSFYLGDLAGMIRRRDRYLEILRAAGDRASEGRIGVSMQVFAALAADDPGRAAQELTATLQRWPRGGFVLERGHAFLAARAIEVYSGDGPRAWARCEDRWSAYSRSYLYQGQHGRVMGEFWRGAAALLAARVTPGRAGDRLRTIASQAMARLTAEGARWADPLAHLLRAGTEVQRGRNDRAQAALVVATAGLDCAEMRLWAAAARWQAGRLVGDRARCAAQEQRMRELGVVAPERMAAALVPGFAP